MNKITKATRLVLLAAGMLVAAAVWAAPAIDTQVQYQQPDGSVVTSYIHGDEFFNYRTTEDGYVVVENEAGYLEYADPNAAELKPSGYRVSEGGLRSTSNFKDQLTPGLTPAQQAFANDEYAKNKALNEQHKTLPFATVAETAEKNGFRAANHSGSLKFLVIMVEFTDKSFSKSQAEFNNMLNQSNFNGTGSTADFYKASSWDQFKPTFDVWGPVRVNMTSAEAKASTPTMVYYACQIIESWGCDFTQYDTDNDGIVDNVYCFFAGYDQAQGGDANCIWSHASSIYWKHQYAPDGKWINGYGCSSELKGNSGQNRVNIGTFTHEFGHVIGLPDFYITSGSGHSPGSWDTMAGGCYSNDSQSPPLFSAYEREMLGWCTIPTLPSGTVTIPNLQGDKNTPAYRVNTSKNNEWYILEYRVKTQYRNYGLPSNGMLIWHVDRSLSGWNSNNPNGTSGHPGYDVFDCNNNGTYGNVNNGDSPFNVNVMWPFGGRNAVTLVDWQGQNCISLNSITDHSTYATVNSGGSSGGGSTTTCTHDDAPVAWLYQDANYGGESNGLGEGNFKLSDLQSRCIADNWVSSIKILPGYKMIAYVDDNFGGSSITWTSDQTYVGADWNDKISSIKIMPNGTTGKSGLWKIKNRNSGKYWDCDGNTTADNTKVVQWADEGIEAYQQWELEETSTGVYHIRPASNLNTRVEVYYGYKDNGTGLVMYPQTENYWNAEFILFAKGSGYFQLIARHCGKPLEMAGSTTDNGAQVKIYDNNGTNAQQWQLLRNQPDGCGHATFYRDCNYEGVAITLSEGYYDAWQLRLYGIGNDQLSSIKVIPGYKVTIWDGEGTGTKKTYTGNVDCLVADGMNDKTSSIAIDPVGKSGLAGTYQVQGKNSKLYWGIKSASKNNSVDLQQQALDATESQTWTLSEYGTTGVYCITNVNSGKVLDVNSAVCTSTSDNRASISQYTYTDGAYHQQFIAVDKGSGYYQFVDRHSGMVIEVPDNKTTACDLKMWKNNDQACSQWKLLQPSYDKWIISAENPTGNYFDLRWNEIYAWSGVEGKTTTGAYEGTGAIAWMVNATDTWWGWGIHNVYQTVDMSAVKNWYICFAIKTNCTDDLAVKIAGTNGEYSVPLTGTYAVARNGGWQTMCIPFSAFTSQGMQLGSQTENVLFSIVCENATNGSKNKYMEVDNVYYSKTAVTPTQADAALAGEAALRLYPNPAADYVNVVGTQAGEAIVIYDLLGCKVAETDANEGITTISIATLPKGNYLVRTSNGNLRLVK